MALIKLNTNFMDDMRVARLSDAATVAYIKAICATSRKHPVTLPRAAKRELIGLGLLTFDGQVVPQPDLFRLPVRLRRKPGSNHGSPMRRAWDAMRWRVREFIYDRDGRRCLLCGATEPLEVDHRIPLARGGTNDLENLQTLCAPCNRRKGAS